MKNILLILACTALAVSVRAQSAPDVPTQYNEATVAQLQAKMAAGTLTSVELTKYYLARIVALDQSGSDNGVNSIIELNPDALEMAEHADR